MARFARFGSVTGAVIVANDAVVVVVVVAATADMTLLVAVFMVAVVVVDVELLESSFVCAVCDLLRGVMFQSAITDFDGEVVPFGTLVATPVVDVDAVESVVVVDDGRFDWPMGFSVSLVDAVDLSRLARGIDAASSSSSASASFSFAPIVLRSVKSC